MKPTDILKDEHRNIEKMLTLLETAVTRVEKGERLSEEIFRDAIHFIRYFADGCHHHKEETLLFPAMEQKGFPREGGPIAVMLHEHDEGRAQIRALDEAVSRYAQGEAGAEQDVAKYARAFIGMLRAHIQKEDNILFMMADQHFSESDQANLMNQFQHAETSSAACSTKSDLLKLVSKVDGQLK